MNLLKEWKEGFLLEGLMPERALLRLQRAGISLYNVKKVEKNQILFYVKRKDSEKVFAIYPNLCYNNSVYSPYTVKKLRAIGALKYVEWSKRRVGLLLGGLLCVCMVLVSEQFVFSIELTGTQAYAREVKMALEEAGIRPFFPYQTGKEDLICANLLAIEDVEYCSVRKIGHRVIVELRTSPFSQMQKNDNVMQAKHSGTLAAMTVLRGTPLKKIGESVVEGEPLVGNWLQMEAGGQVRVEIIARVRIACVWEGTIEAESEEEAFAKTFLLLGLADGHKMTDKEIVEHDGLYRVKIAYEAIETLNF